MKKVLAVMGYILLIMSMTGCALLKPRLQPAAQVNNNLAAPLPSYSGPKAKIAVADFEVKAAKATAEIGSGLREMLITALTNSNRFLVVERQALSAVTQEQEPKIKTADLIITAAVTEFEPQASGGRAGIGGGGGVGSGVWGGLLGSAVNKAHMALNIQIVDTSTSEVLAASRLQGQASDVTGAIMGGSFGSWGLGMGLSAYANTPIEKAIRVCIIEALRYISQTIPTNYYKY